jgi:hypothetical protein
MAGLLSKWKKATSLEFTPSNPTDVDKDPASSEQSKESYRRSGS